MQICHMIMSVIKQRRGLVVMNHDLRSIWPGEPASGEGRKVKLSLLNRLLVRCVRVLLPILNESKTLDARASSLVCSNLNYNL